MMHLNGLLAAKKGAVEEIEIVFSGEKIVDVPMLTLNQYDSITTGAIARSPLYDDNGNMSDDGGTQSYVWDDENRLKQVDSATQRIVFTYDGLGRRITKSVSTWEGSSLVPEYTSTFLYDGWNLLREERVVAGSSTSASASLDYAWGLDLSGSAQGAGGVGGLLAVNYQSDTEQKTYYAVSDHNGNVSRYVDQATGTVAATFDYDAFGNQTQASFSSDVSNPARTAAFAIRFSSKYQDAESGLYYYGYRYYDPQSGRWLSRDPIGEQGGLNLYGFVGNDGVNGVDLWGLVSKKGFIKKFCKLDPCIRQEYLKKIGNKRIVFVDNPQAYDVFIDSLGKEYHENFRSILGSRKGTEILIDQSISAGSAILTGFHEADHIDNDLPYKLDKNDPETWGPAVKIYRDNEIRAFVNETEFTIRAGLKWHSDFFLFFRKSAPVAEIEEYVKRHYGFTPGSDKKPESPRNMSDKYDRPGLDYNIVEMLTKEDLVCH
jgi:RHS repeat-associated protein